MKYDEEVKTFPNTYLGLDCLDQLETQLGCVVYPDLEQTGKVSEISLKNVICHLSILAGAHEYVSSPRISSTKHLVLESSNLKWQLLDSIVI